ncbi:MAG: L-iditol 2-dehydrogenase [Chloroflexota bacterium]|nr:L-iditol 2-dehydrogenase [Chloroflexota bacterium]
MRLQGKVAIVTGGAQGIGAAISRRYATEGARMVVADRNGEGASTVASEISDRGGEAIGVTVDVTNRDQVESMVASAVERFGGVDILVNNAGVIKLQTFLDVTEDDWNYMFDVNCKGMLWCSQAVARQMIEQHRGGKIINLASQAGRRGEALALAYCASKACVISMTQSLALALAPHRINVNGIAPGIVDTQLWVGVDQQFAKLLDMNVGEPIAKFVETIPLGRIEQPDDVAGAALFLASAEADYITQQTLNVDGGNWPS